MTREISPIDGRYRTNVESLNQYFSEWALMKYRVQVEVEWLITLSNNQWISDLRPFTAKERSFLKELVTQFDDSSFFGIKEIEQTTKHDVKATEYFIKSSLEKTTLADVTEFVHFGCTSEDINNLSYALMVKEGIVNSWLPLAKDLVNQLLALVDKTKEIPMLSYTHGQPATPTTIGKEMAIFVYRWQRQLDHLNRQEYLGKFNGAVGNFNAHSIAYPNAPWEQIAHDFVTGLGLVYNPLTTQIESHDYLAECFHTLIRFNNITLDFARDMWSYISMGYFKQRTVKNETGSSVMPHKVNPIDFENAEANLGISNSVLEHLANKLPVSRLQRDLSDSSAMRNVGVGLAHSYIALQSAGKGLSKVSVNLTQIERELSSAWEVLGEAIQTVMRKAGYSAPYEQMKELTRGVEVSQDDMHKFIRQLNISEDDKQHLLSLTPTTYTGLAAQLAEVLSKVVD